MKEYKSVVSSTWAEFIPQLKASVLEGKQIVMRLEYSHSFFKAVLVQGHCPEFVSALESVTGAEVNVLETIDNLLKAANVKSEVTHLEVVKAAEDGQKSFERFVETGSVLETKQDIDVEIVKPKVTTRKRKTTKGE